MKVSELITRLSELEQDADVCFDTEAQCYDVHLVSIDAAWPVSTEEIGREVVCLHEHADHRFNNHEARITELESQLAVALKECELRYTHEEVALWLGEYHGRYREKTLTDWVRERRAALKGRG